MRKWHRWVSVVFGVVLLWMALTGVAMQLLPLVARGGGEHRGPAAAAAGVPPGFKCPETMSCRPKKRGGAGDLKGVIQHLHSGESLGPIGVVVSTLSGIALLFFAVSGLVMYIQLWRNRARRGLSPRWFWN